MVRKPVLEGFHRYIATLPLTLAARMARSFVPAFLGAMVFFAFILELVDLFANIAKYLGNDIPPLTVLRSMLLYLPKCLSFALPVSSLFAASYVFGVMYANNELIIVYGSGISIYGAALPLLFLAAALSIGGFYLDDRVVIPAQKTRTRLLRQLTGQKLSLSNAEITLIGKGKNTIWHADYYDDSQSTLSGPSVVELDAKGRFLSRIEALRAVWEDGVWSFKNARIFSYDAATGEMRYRFESAFFRQDLAELPESFRARKADMDELNAGEALDYVNSLKNSGLPFSGVMAEYHKRYSFSLTPFIVVLLSVGTAGRFRKNVLLTSLLLSLLTATLYYVLQMVTMLLAKNGTLTPILGAYIPAAAFMGVGGFLIWTTRT
ncbi:MAG: LptF/LptG family permease [Spirochaetes bacterium]|nr:LptF/LptG family permease [Spirochaetota bacterium]